MKSKDQKMALILKTRAVFQGLISILIKTSKYHKLQVRSWRNMSTSPSEGIFFHPPPQRCLDIYIQPLGSAGLCRAEEVIKQDAKPLRSDSGDTDLLFHISDGGFYLPDKCQKCHSPSTITLAARPTFSTALPASPAAPPVPSRARRSSEQGVCNTAAISQTVILEGTHTSPKS